jgi:hypothetical protein
MPWQCSTYPLHLIYQNLSVVNHNAVTRRKGMEGPEILVVIFSYTFKCPIIQSPKLKTFLTTHDFSSKKV